jgi:hypothetical protein
MTYYRQIAGRSAVILQRVLDDLAEIAPQNTQTRQLAIHLLSEIAEFITILTIEAAQGHALPRSYFLMTVTTETPKRSRRGTPTLRIVTAQREGGPW